MNRKSFALASLLIVVALVLAACATAEPTATKAPAEATKAPEPTATEAPAVSEMANTLVVAEDKHPFTFDPLIGWTQIIRVAVQSYDALVQYKLGTYEIIPWLAKEWDISDDALTYTFKLREGVKFHDGTDLTASDVKFTFERAMRIKEGLASALQTVDSIETVDDYTLVIKLTEPTGPFMEWLTRLFIISEEGVKANSTDDDPEARLYLVDHDLGSGPYMLTKSIPEQEAVFEKFDDYWQGWEGNHLDRIVWLYIKERATQRLMLEAAEIDIAQDLAFDDLDALEANPDIQVLSFPSANSVRVSFRVIRPPLDDVRVRKALTMAFDVEALIEAGYSGRAKPKVGPYGTDYPWYNHELEPIPFDLESAKALLAEAGYPDGGFSLTMLYDCTQGDQTALVELWGANLAQLGITLNAKCSDYMTIVGMANDKTADFDLVVDETMPMAIDPIGNLERSYHSRYLGQLADNKAWYINPELEELFAQGRAETDPAKREEIYKKCQEIIYNDHPALWTAERDYVIAARNWVKGYKYGGIHYESVWVYDMWLEGKP